MNKKIITWIIVGILVCALLAVGIVFAVGKLGGKTGEPDTSEPKTSSQISQRVTPDDELEKPIEEGNIGIPEVTGKAGNTVEVPIKMGENPGFYAGQFYFKYDTSALTFDGYDAGDVLDGYTVEETESGTVGCILECNGTADTTKTGTLITLKFKIKDGAKPGDYPISLTDKTMLANYDSVVVVPKISTGKVTVQ